MKRLAVALAWVSLMATGCREIWYYQPMEAQREVRDGKGYWIDLKEVEFGSYCPFIVAPWKRGEESVQWGFKLRNKTDAELRIENVHLRVGDLRIRPMYVPEDKANGSRVPARGESEYSAWFSFPDGLADRPSAFELIFDLVTPQGVRTEQVKYSS